MDIQIENLKCGGCANTIVKGLSAIDGVTDVAVHNDTNQVSMNAGEAIRPAVLEKLRSMGYPEAGSISGLASGIATAKSFVSCAIGRVT
jgi:copper chaperone